MNVIVASVSTAFRAGIRALLSQDSEFESIIELAGPTAQDDAKLDAVDSIWVMPLSDTQWGFARFREKIYGSAGCLWIGDVESFLSVRNGETAMLKAWGLLSPNASGNTLQDALRLIAHGLAVVPPELFQTDAKSVSFQNAAKTEDLLEPLSEREVEVLTFLAQGMANKAIALKMQLSENTIKFHVSSVYSKLDVSNRTEALRKGALLGLVAL